MVSARALLIDVEEWLIVVQIKEYLFNCREDIAVRGTIREDKLYSR